MEGIDFFRTRYVNNADELAKLLSARQAAEKLHDELSDISAHCSAIECMRSPAFEELLPHFRRILESDSIRKYFEQEVRCSLRSDIYQPVGKVINNAIMTGLQFIETQRFGIAAIVVDPTALAFKKHRSIGKAASVRMAPKDALLRFIKAGEAVVTIYSCDPINDACPATSNTRCRLERTFKVKNGEEIILRAGQDSLSFESSKSSACFVQAYLKHSSAAVTPEFDARSLKLLGVSAANDVSSRIQLMITILRIFKQGNAFDDCIPFTKHPDYFVRWYVMREMLGMDAERAWPVVLDMAEHDPSQEVRDAAARTIKMFSSPSITA